MKKVNLSIYCITITRQNIPFGECKRDVYVVRNMDCTKTNAIVQARISSNIKDIQGMLISSVSCQSSYFNKSCDANLINRDVPCKHLASKHFENCDISHPSSISCLPEQILFNKTEVNSACSRSSISSKPINQFESICTINLKSVDPTILSCHTEKISENPTENESKIKYIGRYTSGILELS